MEQENYPGVFDRIKAIVVDWIVQLIFMFIGYFLFSQFDNVPDYVPMLVMIFIFLLYDPIFTSTFGGTLGHMFVGIRVKSESNVNKNISFPIALVRYIAKAFLGIISLFTVFGNKKRKAIHDFLVGSVVVYS
jgi:uncharacterized RDD family membrane protein YckC